MKKFPITLWILITIGAAIFAKLIPDLIDKFHEFWIQQKLCVLDNGLCLFIFDGLVIITIIIVGFLIDIVLAKRDAWFKVALSGWVPILSHVALCGVKVVNNKDVDLEDCTAELTGYISDIEIGFGMKGIASHFYDTLLPSKLFWFVDNEMHSSVKIGRGREGYIMIAFPTSKEKDMQIAGKDFQFKIRTVNHEFIHPFEKGFLFIRLGAKVENKSITLKNISVRIEVQEKSVFVKEILELPQKRKLWLAKK